MAAGHHSHATHSRLTGSAKALPSSALVPTLMEVTRARVSLVGGRPRSLLFDEAVRSRCVTPQHAD
ncbi:hypothetical protein E2C01_029151 [Portunus trituberculatus]|uniref:Uncharacterized protein n=1 Tax=Portunus trituberculatus TaxID=210409 RepID=A0A5B7ER34_PORTR|nr:hypothetical protein [Portunus trituberculatus]